MLSEQANTIGIARYYQPEETWEGCSLRSAICSSNRESDPKKYAEKFHEIIYETKFLPAGRILRNSLLPKGSLLNCFHKSIGDSIEEIGQFIKEALILWSEGGGIGTTLSNLRPTGAPILGKGGTSSGPISFLKAIDATALTIESGGSRRAAGLAELFVGHPDIHNFIKAKSVDKLLTAFNISVGINEKFMDAVQSSSEWNLMFNRQIYDIIPAKFLWDRIIYLMWKHAEPGLINLDYLRENNSYYFAPISGCNPCGEATLEDNGACDLGSIVLPRFQSKTGRTNWKELGETIHLAVRFLDNILDANNYPMDNIRQAATTSRRIGLGWIGLAEYLFNKRIRYGSEESLRVIEKLARFYRNTAYEASIKLAKEKGTFPKFDSTMYSKAKFIRKLPVSLRKEIRKYGTRNCTILAMPPTGTTSLLADCTSGIEPLFSKAYRRDDRISSRIYIHPLCNTDAMESSWFVDAFDLTPEDHLSTQAIVQQYTDGSVSKTINLPHDSTKEELGDLLLEYINDVKGVTVYRDGCRDGQPLNRLTEEEIKKETDGTSARIEEDVKCSSGTCEI